MALIDLYTRLCGAGQAVLDTAPGEVSSAWFDMGELTNRIFGGGQLVVARFGCTVTPTSGDPDNTVQLQIVHTPITLATPTTARTLAAIDTATAINATTEVITLAAHGMTNGTRVTSDATLGGITLGTNYYIRDATTNTFKLAATPGGTALNLSADTGNVTLTWYPEVIVSTGPIGFNRIIAGDFLRELAIGPHELSRAYPTGRYVYAMFTGVSDLTAGTFTCDLVGGFAMDGRPYNKVNYVTA